MKFKIIHETTYQFSSQVFLEPQYLRLKPKPTPYSKLETFRLKFSPKPAGISEQTDAEENCIHLCWFEGTHQDLSIRSESLIDVLENHNPFNFIVYPADYLVFPFQYSEPLQTLLSPTLGSHRLGKAVVQYAEAIRLSCDEKTVPFLIDLTKQIHEDFKASPRHEGPPFEPEKTFDLKKGSCRDLAWLQIHILRHFKIAARFVSGYYYVQSETPEYELHAWVEAFLPGAGWVGFDPSAGVVVGSSHIPVATSAFPQQTMPLTGIFRGNAKSKLSSDLIIEPIKS
ncbi:transglutaminase domain protein [Chloroherpeton thalassium ATCC 35110]|uniref:Transglutaminase domain protein n=1 Tax=Chloroherpeton thalassium (strain ATCC 35110 / GB-78) TaxID=517418 RepID=B3QX26_CHLT3|nr:transglutaminase family protein [Chloroherpeton thalassium]ACF14836.1 transglutaminase domain protein [Chloroherpeton thalassium ATCC 35110]